MRSKLPILEKLLNAILNAIFNFFQVSGKRDLGPVKSQEKLFPDTWDLSSLRKNFCPETWQLEFLFLNENVKYAFFPFLFLNENLKYAFFSHSNLIKTLVKNQIIGKQLAPSQLFSGELLETFITK